MPTTSRPAPPASPPPVGALTFGHVHQQRQAIAEFAEFAATLPRHQLFLKLLQAFYNAPTPEHASDLYHLLCELGVKHARRCAVEDVKAVIADKTPSLFDPS